MLRILNSEFDRQTGEIAVHVHVNGVCEPAWIDVDSLISNYHGAGSPTKESIQRAIGCWLRDRHAGEMGRSREVTAMSDAVESLKGNVLTF